MTTLNIVPADSLPMARKAGLAQELWAAAVQQMYLSNQSWAHITVGSSDICVSLRANLHQRSTRTRRPHNPDGPFPMQYEFHRRKQDDGQYDIYFRLTPVNSQDLAQSYKAAVAAELDARLDAEEDAALAALDAELAAALAAQDPT